MGRTYSTLAKIMYEYIQNATWKFYGLPRSKIEENVETVLTL
jgi:hypothetical protein